MLASIMTMGAEASVTAVDVVMTKVLMVVVLMAAVLLSTVDSCSTAALFSAAGATAAVRAGETITLEAANGHVGINAAGGIETFDSPYLFALNGQPDREGSINYELYAAFQRSIAGGHKGGGITRVVITLYPAP